LFHAASLWALSIASRTVDMVFYASVPENNQIVQQAKQEFRNGIVITRDQIDDYAAEADAILIGPGMVRAQSEGVLSIEKRVLSIAEISELEDEGLQTRFLTKYMLEKYPHKKFILDAGALQMMDPEWLLQVKGNVVITPHPREFETAKFKVQNAKLKVAMQNAKLEEQVSMFAKEFNTVVLLKGKEDIVCSPTTCVKIAGGNPGMTKGGTGDVLAGLVAGLACNNDMFLSACAASYFNKRAGESLEQKVGMYFNSTDLANALPSVIHQVLTSIS
jgi:NAD(P)H-hydrate epimerase